MSTTTTFQQQLPLIKQALVETKTPVFKLMQDLGASNAQSWGKTFKKVTGMTPTEYRVAHTSSSEEGLLEVTQVSLVDPETNEQYALPQFNFPFIPDTVSPWTRIVYFKGKARALSLSYKGGILTPTLTDHMTDTLTGDVRVDIVRRQVSAK